MFWQQADTGLVRSAIEWNCFNDRPWFTLHHVCRPGTEPTGCQRSEVPSQVILQ